MAHHHQDCAVVVCEAQNALMECYRITDWDMFRDDCRDDLDGLT